MSNDISLHFDEIRAETDDAYLIYIEDEELEVWLPKSQIRMREEKSKIYLPEWLAKKHGLYD